MVAQQPGGSLSEAVALLNNVLSTVKCVNNCHAADYCNSEFGIAGPTVRTSFSISPAQYQQIPASATMRRQCAPHYQAQRCFGKLASAPKSVEFVSVQEILLELPNKISTKQQCKFNINCSAVWEGAVRGFRRLSFDTNSMISVKFSDDVGKNEEGVDLGGPRREFSRVLMETIASSTMFEGAENSKNLALNSAGDAAPLVSLYSKRCLLCFHGPTDGWSYGLKAHLQPSM
ncbi:hypothetical protein CRENBAI_019899 [Crenichthys baileyi]|uniref:HECT domain-containing protein n=1 Tax=Crenichthys baileyi TaxID=28760 RepID=A0AAV9SR40_9TELE